MEQLHHKTAPLDSSQIDELRELSKRDETAKFLGSISKNTLARALASLSLRPGTRLLIEKLILDLKEGVENGK